MDLHFCQTKYTIDILQQASMLGAKPIHSPFVSGSKLSSKFGDPLSDATHYRSIVRALQYLTLTRPDIAFAINQACQFMHAPTTIHGQAIKRIL